MPGGMGTGGTGLMVRLSVRKCTAVTLALHGDDVCITLIEVRDRLAQALAPSLDPLVAKARARREM
jgi:hypothetical protein